MMRTKFWARWAVAAALAVAGAFPVHAQDAVAEAMDAIVTRLYETMSVEELYAIDDAKVQEIITPEERAIFATKHLYFDVNVPVVVSLFHRVEQAVVPFWIEEAGFTKTDMKVFNVENWEYDVWQKEFPAGRVELGVNGFDYFRPHYLVSVGPKNAGDTVTIANLHPSKYPIVTTEPGAKTYNDWSELKLRDVPESLIGQQLITTIRGRGREAALVQAFRQTIYPSSVAPAPVYLTWSEDPRTSMTVQWRTSAEVEDGVVLYRKRGSDDAFTSLPAEIRPMDDLMLANDRFCHWYRAVVTGLEPETVYEYQVGSPNRGAFSVLAEFATAPESPAPFSFFHLSDTHNNPLWGKLMKETLDLYPQAAFSVISGDLVGTGLVRDDWDKFFTYGQSTFQVRPVMPSKGNHDSQLGLGAAMYHDLFGLPENGPAELEPRGTYTFTYSNAQFFMMDVMSDEVAQTAWLEEQLKNSTATWKFAVFHFPFYELGEGYPRLESTWGALFDKYHLDIVLCGHIHRYMRTYPLKGGKIVGSPAEGTIHISSVCIPSRPTPGRKADITEVQLGGGSFVNLLTIDGNRLEFKAVSNGGQVKDEFVIQK